MGTSVPEALGHTFYATRRHVYCIFDTDGMTSVSTLVWYHTQKKHATYSDQQTDP